VLGAGGGMGHHYQARLIGTCEKIGIVVVGDAD